MSKSLVSLNLHEILEPEKSIREKIDPMGIQELAESLKKLGQLQPILVRKESGAYRIEAGHRRYLAARLAGWSVIDAIILEPVEEEALHLEQAHENLIRSDLNAVEEAKICWNLVYEDGRGVERAAKLLCKPESWVNSRLDIWQLQEDLKDAIRNQEISVAVARVLTKEKDDEKRRRLLISAVEYGASAAVVDRWRQDSNVGIYLEQKEMDGPTEELQTVLMTATKMPCRVCNLDHNMNILRHIWICPDCMASMRELAFEVRKQIGLEQPVGDQQ